MCFNLSFKFFNSYIRFQKTWGNRTRPALRNQLCSVIFSCWSRKNNILFLVMFICLKGILNFFIFQQQQTKLFKRKRILNSFPQISKECFCSNGLVVALAFIYKNHQWFLFELELHHTYDFLFCIYILYLFMNFIRNIFCTTHFSCCSGKSWFHIFFRVCINIRKLLKKIQVKLLEDNNRTQFLIKKLYFFQLLFLLWQLYNQFTLFNSGKNRVNSRVLLVLEFCYLYIIVNIVRGLLFNKKKEILNSKLVKTMENSTLSVFWI